MAEQAKTTRKNGQVLKEKRIMIRDNGETIRKRTRKKENRYTFCHRIAQIKLTEEKDVINRLPDTTILFSSFLSSGLRKN